MALRSLLHFGRKSRADSGLAVASSGRNRPRSSPRTDAQLNPPDPKTVLSQWQRLRSLDPKSHDYDELLRTLVDEGGNRRAAMGFAADDAGIVIDIIGEALKSGRLRGGLAHMGFVILRKLAGTTGRLPDNYLVNKGADFQIEEGIFACGGFADVRKGVLVKKAVAVKTIRVTQDSNFSKIRKDFCKESVLWMHTSHTNVLELIAVNIDPQSGALSMISELMENGNIMDYIRANEANRICLLNDVINGLSYLHKCKIIHGDLKGTNILIKNGANPQACISDFGFSTVTTSMSLAVSVTGEGCKGTWSHMAPELLNPEIFGLRTSRVSKEADVYAFGMIVYEVLTGRPPFSAEKRRQPEIVFRVLEGKRPRKPEKAGDIGFGRGTWDLVQQCWNQDRGERPTVEKISKHFQRVARNSSTVPPGPTTSAYEPEAPAASEPDSGRNFARLFIQSSQRGASVLQQTRLTANFMSGGNIHTSFTAPDVQMQTITAKPSLFERLGARIMGRRSAFRLDAPKSPPTRT